MAYYVTRRATMAAAVNVAVPVNLDFEGNAAGAITIPQSVSKIAQLIIAVGASVIAIASAGVTLGLRLAGTGLIQGQQDIAAGAVREDTTSTGGTKGIAPFVLDTDIPVTPGQIVSMSAFMGGVDPGSPEVMVTVVFA